MQAVRGTIPRGGGGGGDSHIKRTEVLVVPFRGFKNGFGTRPLLKAAKYEIQKPSTCRATLFRCKFLSMFRVFHLA